MKHGIGRRRKKPDTVAVSGWLFADLLLGVAMLFFVFNSVGKLEEPTVTPTPTVVDSPTPTSTSTPTVTLIPTPTSTFTPRPTATIQPTYTPFPTRAPLPTYTPFPTHVSFPTYTPLPTYTPQSTYTPVPTVRVGLELLPEEYTLKTDVAALLGRRGSNAKRIEEQSVRSWINQTMRYHDEQDHRAGIVLTFGHSSQAGEGNALAASINRLLRQERPRIFGDAAFEDFHWISSQSGRVVTRIYFLTE